MIALLLSVTLAASPFGTFGGTGKRGTGGSTPPVASTFACYGNSIMAGTCSPTPPCEAVGNAIAGSRVANEAVSGYTAAQIKACYLGQDLGNCAGYTTACGGEECAQVLLEGGVNDLKGVGAVTGVVEAAALATMLEVVDHALNRGVPVYWLDVLPYASCTEPTCSPASLTDAHDRATTYNSLKAAACGSEDRPNRHLLHCIAAYEDFEDPEEEGALSGTYACADDFIHLKQAGSNLMACKYLTALGVACP